MPERTNVFFKVNADFMLSDEKDPQGLVKNFSKLSKKVICFNSVNEPDELGNRGMYFEGHEEDIVDGILEINLEDESVHVICDAIFMLSVSPEYLDQVLSVDKWYLTDVPYEWDINDEVAGSWYEVISGLEEHSITYMTSRGKEIEDGGYLLTVKCSENKNDLE